MGNRIIVKNLAEMATSRENLAKTRRSDEDDRFDSIVSELRDMQGWDDSSILDLFGRFIKERGLCLEMANFLINAQQEENQ